MTTAVAEKKRILFVDDNERIREIYKGELEYAGYEVITAADGPEALRLVEQNKPGQVGGLDLVLLDIKMPGMDGLEVLGKIKQSHKNLPVILLSAYGAYKQDFSSWKAEDYVVKSSNPTELLETVKKYI